MKVRDILRYCLATSHWLEIDNANCQLPTSVSLTPLSCWPPTTKALIINIRDDCAGCNLPLCGGGHQNHAGEDMSAMVVVVLYSPTSSNFKHRLHVELQTDGSFAALLACLARCPSPARWRSGRRTSSSTATTTSTTRRRASSRSSGTSTRIPRLSSSGSLACQTAREAYMRYDMRYSTN